MFRSLSREGEVQRFCPRYPVHSEAPGGNATSPLPHAHVGAEANPCWIQFPVCKWPTFGCLQGRGPSGACLVSCSELPRLALCSPPAVRQGQGAERERQQRAPCAIRDSLEWAFSRTGS